MKSQMKFEFTLSVQDYKNSVRIFYSKQRSTWTSLSVTGVLFLYGVYLMVNPESQLSTYSFFALLPFPFILFTYFMFSPYRMGQVVSASVRFTVLQQWRVNKAGIQITNEFGELKFEWSDFRDVVESKDFLLLQYSTNKNAFQIVPKRAFTSVGHQEAFLDMAKQKVEEKRKKRRK